MDPGEDAMSAKDWTGDQAGVLRMIGARNFALEEREENDYYATDPRAIDLLLTKETPSRRIWEPSSGGGSFIEPIKATGFRGGVLGHHRPRGAGLPRGLPAMQGALRRRHTHQPAIQVRRAICLEGVGTCKRKGVYVPKTDLLGRESPL